MAKDYETFIQAMNVREERYKQQITGLQNKLNDYDTVIRKQNIEIKYLSDRNRYLTELIERIRRYSDIPNIENILKSSNYPNNIKIKQSLFAKIKSKFRHG